MSLTAKTRIGRKNTLYIPKSVAEAVGLRESTLVRLVVRGDRIIIEPVLDPFELALRRPKFATIKFEEFERESEEMQHELFENQD